jgi:hypothetical protein
MSLLKTFEVMSGSTTGSNHRFATPPAPNQDQVRLVTTDELIIGAFSDGCSSGSLSQMGAQRTVDVLATGIYNRHQRGKPLTSEWFKRLYWFLVESLWDEARLQLPAERREDDDAALDVLMDRGLATAGGFILDPRSNTAYRFYVPETFGVLNGQRFCSLAAKKHHAPYPALAYHNQGEPHFGNFHVDSTPLDELMVLGMGTDGVERLQKVCDNGRGLPVTEPPISGFEGIFTRDEFYANPAACNAWLNTLAEAGFLGDDTSFVGVRRRKEK